MSVEKLAKITCISSRHINEIESGNFASIPGKAYVLGFTRTVSKKLGLDDTAILSIVKSELYGELRIDSGAQAPFGVSARSIGGVVASVLGLSRDRKPEPETVTYAV